MDLGRTTQVLGRRVQVDLRAADAAVTEKVADCYELHALLHQMSRERVSKPVWRDALVDPRFPRVGPNSFVDSVARHASAMTTSEKRSHRCHTTAR